MPRTHFSLPLQPGLLRLFTHCRKMENPLQSMGSAIFLLPISGLPAGSFCEQQGVWGLENFKEKIQFEETRVRCEVAWRGWEKSNRFLKGLLEGRSCYLAFNNKV